MDEKPKTIDEYLALVPADRRETLQKLRQTILSIIPTAAQCISYGMPAFRLAGTVVAGFASTAKGCSYYPFSGSTLATLATELKGYHQTKASIHFRADKPLPAELVHKLIKTRVAEAGTCGTQIKAGSVVRHPLVVARNIPDARAHPRCVGRVLALGETCAPKG